ncbi:MAG: 16S rRNA (adenine(1518)-N(6)/adenine(1519)-N(6))-dimethyltransferase RsmA [Bacteroidales bacterium]|nr:16S rRNA (adenine(1518)-N(6)/adenine(1519)-N(6))-dimethyltransferase RsmA [Bacteroidales bacterium]
MSEIKPKKSLGQHFLHDSNIANKIVNALGVYSKTNVLEIGPGTGILTGIMLNNGNIDLHCIEIDKRAIDTLAEKFPSLNNRLHHGDFLNFNLIEIFSMPFCVIGNFPYNISSQIFFKILEYRASVTEVVCMIQKEVAERLAAPPGSKTYGILSVFLKAYFDVEYLFSVNPQVFTPPPNVISAVIKLKRNTVEKLLCNEELFFKVVKLAFNQRRKMLRNSLKSFLIYSETENPIFQKRPEQLSVSEFVELTNLVEDLIQKQ